MSSEMNVFLRFLVADAFARRTMNPKLKEVYENFEKKLESALVAAGGVTLSQEEENKITKRVAGETPGIKEARAAYLLALESYNETDSE